MNACGALAARVIRHHVTDLTLYGAIERGRPVIVSVAFGYHRHHRAVPEKPPAVLVRAMDEWCDSLAGFLDGRVRRLDSLPIYLGRCTVFERAVLTAARKIPWGTTVTYAELARRAGRPRAIRAAASVMRRNPYPVIVPCHRVVTSTGALGGFMGRTSGKALSLKRQLLEREGVVVRDGQVSR